MEPESRTFTSQRLRIRYVVWGDEANEPLVLVHGGRDHARSWDFVVERLVDRYCCYCIDLRGHGDSDWSVGSQYSLPEFVADVTALLDHLGRDPLSLVGHSLGGAVVLQVAGVLPDRVKKVCAIEGWGPKIIERTPAHLRMRRWLEQLEEFADRQPRRYASLEEAARRMREENSFLSPGLAMHLTVHGARRNEDGSYSWKFDNYVRMHSPYEFNIDDARVIWNQFRCPTLLVRGDKSWAADPEEDGKASAFHNYRSVLVRDAGHWVHHDQLDEFTRLLRAFLDEE